jgi:hypothetical protein
VAFESNSVTESVSEGSVVGAVPSIGDDFPGNGVDLASSFSGRGEFKRLSLRFAHDVEHLPCFG